MVGISSCHSTIRLVILVPLLLIVCITQAWAQSVPCHSISPTDPARAGFGSAYNVVSNPQELLVDPLCLGNDVTLHVGNALSTTYTYSTAYHWNNSQWNQLTLSCTQPSGPWCLGEGTASFTRNPANNPHYVVGYVCQNVANTWKCGCRDPQCAASYWQLQGVRESVDQMIQFQWPVDSPIPSQGYACPNCLQSQRYPFHTGIDMTSGLYNGTPYDTPINPTVDGLVVGIFITSDPTNTWCNGTRDYFSSSSISSNNHGLGNAVILEHTFGESTIYTLYGHLDCIHWDIVKKHLRIDGAGPSISVADVLGKMGNSAYTKKRCNLGMDCNQDGKVDGFGPHLHFEVKAWGVLGNLSDHSGPYYGYTPRHPNWHGYINPNPLLDYLLKEKSPTIIRVTGNNLPIHSGSDASYAQLGTVSSGQKFVTFSEYNGWYQVYLPSEDGPATGWIQGTVDTSSGWINIVDNASDSDPLERFTGVNVRLYPTTTASTILTKVWQDQQFVIEGAPQSGSGCSASWYKIYLPNGAGAQYGWVCGQYVK